MLNYEVDASLLLPFLPAGTELDRWSEKVFVSLVGFRFLKTKMFGLLPIPMHSNFEEVNLVSYTHLDVYKRQSVDGQIADQLQLCLLYTSRCV